MDWVVDFKGKLEEMETSRVAKDWKKRSIYKVYACSLGLNRTAYILKTVAFGPYHHNEKQLQMQMDAHKHRALHHFLKKSHKPLKNYVAAMQSVVPELMASYDNLDANWQEDTFLQSMLLDGCFMLEILRANDVIREPGDTYGDYGGVADPIFSYHGKLYVMPYIRRDMLMLENQLPMLLLVKLVTTEAIQDENPVHYLDKLILNFVNPRCKIPPDYLQEDSLHVLDLYRKSLLGLERSQPQMGRVPIYKVRSACFCIERKEGPGVIVSGTGTATKLCDYGVYFKPSDSTSIMDISFDGGELKLPCIIVDDTTESAFLNLMAFERVHVGAGNEVTSFVSFMDLLIHSTKDVGLLHDRGILYNKIGSEEAIANLFKGITKDVTPDPTGSLEKVFNELDDYCNRMWNKWRAYRAYLRRKFFGKDPWAILTLFFFLLTIAQTLYAILTYHHPLKP